MLNNKFFGLAQMVLFGGLAIVAFIGMFYNPWQIVICIMCVVMFLVGLYEFRKEK